MHIPTLTLLLTLSTFSTARLPGRPKAGEVTYGGTVPSTPRSELSPRTCYGSGHRWGGEKGFAVELAQRACREYFLGNYNNKGETRYRCFSLSSSKKVDFTVELLSNGVRTLFVDECFEGLRREIEGCEQGGQSSYTNWFFA